jgi:hypothetical protein
MLNRFRKCVHSQPQLTAQRIRTGSHRAERYSKTEKRKSAPRELREALGC